MYLEKAMKGSLNPRRQETYLHHAMSGPLPPLGSSPLSRINTFIVYLVSQLTQT